MAAAGMPLVSMPRIMTRPLFAGEKRVFERHVDEMLHGGVGREGVTRSNCFINIAVIWNRVAQQLLQAGLVDRCPGNGRPYSA